MGKPRDLSQRSMQKMASLEERYRLLARLGRVINSSLDVRRVFRPAALAIHKLMGCDRVNLVLAASPKSPNRGFALEFSNGVAWVEIPGDSLAGSAAEWVVQHCKPRIASCLEADSPFVDERQLAVQGYQACACLPLVCRRASVGALGLATRQRNHIEHWDFKLLDELGNLLVTALDNAAAYTQIAELKAQLESENVYLREEIGTGRDLTNLVGGSPAMLELRRAIEQVAATDSTVLIAGETGTGKELIARAIHQLSPRRDHLLVKVNCAALPAGVIASELFGHEAEAFTGATKRRIGRFELAHCGSIFMDEIAEIPPETQVLLLRVLQERVIERVGSSQAVEVDVRVIAATNRDLSACVAEGAFRSDLFYRLNVFPVQVPPLRERREDIPALVQHFIDLLGRRMNRQITKVSPGTLELFLNYSWPGNVRELENIVERAMIVSAGRLLEIDPTWLSATNDSFRSPGNRSTFADAERNTILRALERSEGKIYGRGGAARALGLKPTTLYGKMRRLGIRNQSQTGSSGACEEHK